MKKTNGGGDSGIVQRPPTSHDVAHRANVSRATVSYVLNNTPDARIGEETRQRVLEAAAELGYVPHHAAKSLRAKQSDLVLLPFFDWPYNQDSISFLQIFARHLDQAGYTVMLRHFGKTAGTVLTQKMAAMHPVGILFDSAELEQKDIDLLHRHGVKAFFALEYGEIRYPDISSVVVDFIDVGRQVGAHLIRQGHKKIGVIVPRDERIHSLALRRLEGIRQAAETATADIEVLPFECDYTLSEASALVEKWKFREHPTALFTYNDEFAMLMMRALKDYGIQIPDDIALVGCDNLPMCNLLKPRLTSVSMDISNSSHEAAKKFVKTLQTPDSAELYRIRPATQVIVRESG